MTVEQHEAISKHKKYIEQQLEKLHPESEKFTVKIADRKGNGTNWVEINPKTMYKIIDTLKDDLT